MNKHEQMHSLIEDKKALKKIGMGFILLALATILFMVLVPQTQLVEAASVKAVQEYRDNFTCEQMEDSDIWTAVATKDGPVDTYYNWTMNSPCPGNEDCDVVNLSANARYVWPAGVSDDDTTDHAYAQIGNLTESIVADGDWALQFAQDLFEPLCCQDSPGDLVHN